MSSLTHMGGSQSRECLGRIVNRNLSPPRITIDTGTRSPNIAEAMENSSVFSWSPWDPSKMGPVDFPPPWIFSHFVQPRYMVNMVSNCQDNGKHTFSASRAPGIFFPTKTPLSSLSQTQGFFLSWTRGYHPKVGFWFQSWVGLFGV